MSAVWLSPTRCALVVEELIPFLDSSTVLQFDYSRVTRVSSTSCGSSNEPAVFAHFWLRLGRRLLRPHLSCLHSRFTVERSLSWVFALCGVRPGCCCVGDIAWTITAPILLLALRSAADVAVFSPVSRFFALVWGLLLFLRNFHFYSLATLMVYPFLLCLSILCFFLSYYS